MMAMVFIFSILAVLFLFCAGVLLKKNDEPAGVVIMSMFGTLFMFGALIFAIEFGKDSAYQISVGQTCRIQAVINDGRNFVVSCGKDERSVIVDTKLNEFSRWPGIGDTIAKTDKGLIVVQK